jgi:hypothetical protein
MGREILFEQFPVNGLCGGGALSRGYNHLAVSRRNAARRVKPFYRCAHGEAHGNFATGGFGPEHLCQFVEIDIPAGGEERINR